MDFRGLLLGAKWIPRFSVWNWDMRRSVALNCRLLCATLDDRSGPMALWCRRHRHKIQKQRRHSPAILRAISAKFLGSQSNNELRDHLFNVDFRTSDNQLLSTNPSSPHKLFNLSVQMQMEKQMQCNVHEAIIPYQICNCDALFAGMR